VDLHKEVDEQKIAADFRRSWPFDLVIDRFEVCVASRVLSYLFDTFSSYLG
jgi:hypothetical protein